MGQGPTPLYPPLKSSKAVSVTAYSSTLMLDAARFSETSHIFTSLRGVETRYMCTAVRCSDSSWLAALAKRSTADDVGSILICQCTRLSKFMV
jgi:hypothetical protein